MHGGAIYAEKTNAKLSSTDETQRHKALCVQRPGRCLRKILKISVFEDKIKF